MKVFHSTDLRPVHIDIYRFAPTPARPFWTLITGGMSDLRQPALEDLPEGIAPRAELIMYVQKPQTWMFSVLKGFWRRCRSSTAPARIGATQRLTACR